MNIANSFPAAALLLVTMLAPVHAQTNFFSRLNVGDKTYTNATITRVNPAEATVIFDGGGAQVAVSNLPPELRERYHYDPATAARFLAEKEERKAALRKMDADATARAAALSEPVLVKVQVIDAGEKCLTDIGQIWLRNVPAQTAQYLAGRTQLADEIQALTARIEIGNRDAQYAHALAATNAYYNYINPFYGADVMGQMHAANVMAEDVNNEKIELERLSAAYDDYVHQGEHLATVRAAKTTKQYMGMSIWVCLGPGPVPTTNPQHQSPEGEPRTDLPFRGTGR